MSRHLCVVCGCWAYLLFSARKYFAIWAREYFEILGSFGLRQYFEILGFGLVSILKYWARAKLILGSLKSSISVF